MLRPLLFSVAFPALLLIAFGPHEFFERLPRTLFLLSAPVAIYLISQGRSGMQRGKERGEADSSFVLLIVLTVATGFFIPFFSGRKITQVNLSDFFNYTGLLLFHLGMLVRFVAVRTLKRQFSLYVTIQENHQLITTGIYSQIRHPIYLGGLLTLAGFVLLFPTLLGFLFIFFYFMLLGHRMVQEEKLMLKHFGSVYEEYISKSYRLIPHIY